MNVVSFKSVQENYRKEYLNIKNNTIRKLNTEDERKELLDSYMNGNLNDLFIEITNTETREEFSRAVRDVSFWKGWYIITWATVVE